MQGSGAYVRYEVRDRIALVTIDRPPVNALNLQVQEEIRDAFQQLGASSGVGAVIVTGGGEKAFVGGADIKMLSGLDSEGASGNSSSAQSVMRSIEEFDHVVIAAVRGFALGGGCELALACDIRVADESALFGLPEVGLGLLPGAGGTQRLTRLVGPGKAKELILTGDPIDAAEALRIGLVERVVPRGEAVSEAMRLAGRVLMRGPLAVANAKKAIHQALCPGGEEGYRAESRLFGELFSTKDIREGLSAFFEKRSPKFTGK